MKSPLPDWRGRLVVAIASGPSLTAEDCATARAAGVPVIVTNTTFRTCPWADALFAFDPMWWRRYLPEIRETFRGRLYTQSLSVMRGVTCTRAAATWRPWPNSGACAIALAIAAGAARVVMLGYDCGKTGGRLHHHEDHPAPLGNCDSMPKWPAQFARLAEYAAKRGVPVVNASRATALDCFPRADLHVALDGSAHVGGEDGRGDGVGAEHVAGGG